MLTDRRFISFALLGIALILPGASAKAQNSQPPEIMSRHDWGAKPPELSLMTRQSPKAIVIHHTSSKRQPQISLEKKLLNLQAFSQRAGIVENRPKKAWGDIPYHFYIDANGRIGEGRDLQYAGDTNTSYDTKDKIQVVVEGNFEKESPAASQLASLRQLLDWLRVRYGIGQRAIHGHRDLAPTDCPGSNLEAFVKQYRDADQGRN